MALRAVFFTRRGGLSYAAPPALVGWRDVSRAAGRFGTGFFRRGRIVIDGTGETRKLAENAPRKVCRFAALIFVGAEAPTYKDRDVESPAGRLDRPDV
jgi:hypothetical protein